MKTLQTMACGKVRILCFLKLQNGTTRFHEQFHRDIQKAFTFSPFLSKGASISQGPELPFTYKFLQSTFDNSGHYVRSWEVQKWLSELLPQQEFWAKTRKNSYKKSQ